VNSLLGSLTKIFIADSSRAVISVAPAIGMLSVALVIGMLSWCPVELEKNLDRRRKKPQWASFP